MNSSFSLVGNVTWTPDSIVRVSDVSLVRSMRSASDCATVLHSTSDVGSSVTGDWLESTLVTVVSSDRSSGVWLSAKSIVSSWSSGKRVSEASAAPSTDPHITFNQSDVKCVGNVKSGWKLSSTQHCSAESVVRSSIGKGSVLSERRSPLQCNSCSFRHGVVMVT